MDEMNARLEPECRLEWEIEIGIRRLNVTCRGCWSRCQTISHVGGPGVASVRT
jgi:hypothetical protein